ncbi:MAG: phosphoenolpyruvate--protein phosphotransferase [Lentisphaeria bacterium]|nr:phosphoenolpyruvate--protein phosphotransferase [Lentisphaeria bacterium]
MPKNRVELICSVAELTAMFAGGKSLDDFLGNVVKTICLHMKADVCSVYLYDEKRHELVLSATEGLKESSIGEVRLKLGEGITGLAVKELRPILESCGSKNPNFKFIPGIAEEDYEAFLAVPILLGISRVGALVVQHSTPGYFNKTDTQALRAIASQLAGTISNAKLLLNLQGDDLSTGAGRKRKEAGPKKSVFIKGISGSSGVAQGKAVFFGEFTDDALEERIAEVGDRLGGEDFERAMTATESQLDDLHARMREEMVDLSAALIFNAHLLMLRDTMFSGAIRAAIEKGVAPPAAVRETVERFVSLFANSPNPRLREKVQDVRDLGHRLLLNMLPDKGGIQADYAGSIIIAGDLLPTDIIKIVAQNASGLLLTEGNVTAHAAILTRSLGIPLVMISEGQVNQCADGDALIVDADQGAVYVNPGSDIIDRYAELARVKKRAKTAPDLDQSPAVTADGTEIRLMANINLLSELNVAKKFRARGVGLYRSEFPYVVRSNFPSEEEQFRIYRTVLKEMDGEPVVFRTLDVGGDKMLTYFATTPEANPFLGMRAIRLSLTRKDIFEPQIRALLRAGAHGGCGIMFPLISSVDEFIDARTVVHQCMRDLEDEGVEFRVSPRLGVMVEVPSAVEIIEELAEISDFLCLGTNDLVQYLLAVDRTNEQVADFYVPHHPAVLRAIHRVAVAAAKMGKELSICGEMAGNKHMLPFLLGIGIRVFSLDTRKIPVVRDTVRTLNIVACEDKARRMLACGRIGQVEKLLA